MAPLLKFGLPDATGILYGVRAEPAEIQPSLSDGPWQDQILKALLADLNFVVRVEDLVLNANSQGMSGKFLLGLKAYDHDGKVLDWPATKRAGHQTR